MVTIKAVMIYLDLGHNLNCVLSNKMKTGTRQCLTGPVSSCELAQQVKFTFGSGK